MDFPTSATGGCLCGAIRYTVSGAPLSTLYCHCESCRKHTGAPAVAFVGYRRDQLAYTASQPSIYSSSPGVGRAFCGHCGTPLTWEGDGGEVGPLVELYTGTLDNPEAFPPEQHIHHREHLSWFETLDRLPRYSEWHDDGETPYQYGPVAGEGDERESGEEE